MSITTSTGTTVSIEDGRVILTNDNAPDDMRRVEAGRVLWASFQPAPFCEFGLSVECLRAIATLVEQEAGR